MASTLSVATNTSLSVTATYDGDISSGDNTLTYNGLNESATYTSASAVPVTKFASFDKTLSGGAGTIDLTALPGTTANETVDGTGLKVQFAKFRNLSTNANSITITFGAATAYLLLGAAFKIILLPGQSATFQLNEAAPDISSSLKHIDLAGTASQVLECMIIMG